jgi:light-regulated signal transduction histidine kinase (bacteriophytochrome)
MIKRFCMFPILCLQRGISQNNSTNGVLQIDNLTVFALIIIILIVIILALSYRMRVLYRERRQMRQRIESAEREQEKAHLAQQKAERERELRKKEKEALKKFTAKLQKSNQDLQDFAYVASHDLQEPLRKIQAFGDRLQTTCMDLLTDKGKDYLGYMISASDRMQNLVNALLKFSRVTTKALPFKKVDLKQIIQEVLTDLETRLEETQGRVEVGTMPVINADELQMRQLFQNLIGNALKFKKSDSVPIVKVYSKKIDRENHTLFIEDNGIGFEKKYEEKIFQVFQRLHTREQYEGSGMGLAICRKIVERHGGSIIAESVVNQGTRFIMTLPIRHKEALIV